LFPITSNFTWKFFIPLIPEYMERNMLISPLNV
jgi:hypothetical protein